jgi:hypothetical protein
MEDLTQGGWASDGESAQPLSDIFMPVKALLKIYNILNS